jgi:uncharacterized delta-60 repeat protein
MRSLYLAILLFLFASASYSQSALDRSFGDTGVVTVNTGKPTNNFTSTTSQLIPDKDGSFYLFVTYGNTFVKRKSDGSLDSTYGFNGYSVALPSGTWRGALQNDGKLVVAGSTVPTDQFFLTRLNNNGTLDYSFGDGGKKIISFTGSGKASSLAIQPDGKIVVAGTSMQGSDEYFAIARFNADGSLDSSFGIDGTQITDFQFQVPDRGGFITYHNSSASAITLQPDGKILAAGYAYNGNNSGFAVARYNTDGSLDDTFSDDGKQTTILNSSSAFVNCILVQDDGKIILCGVNSHDTPSSSFMFVRYDANGNLDNSFGSQGVSFISPGDPINIFEFYPMAVFVDGKIYASGYITQGDKGDMFIVSLKSDGTEDDSFGNNGRLILDLDNTNDLAGSIGVQPTTSKLLIAATAVYDSQPVYQLKYVVTRINKDGTPDQNFGNNSLVFDDKSLSETFYASTIVLSDGKILSGGYAWNGMDRDFLITKFLTNGTIDSTFNLTGQVFADFGAADQILQLKELPGGKLMAYGKSGTRFAMARYNADGTRDNTFNGTGLFVLDTGLPFSTISIDPDGKIVLAGSTFDGSNVGEAALVRLNANGTFDNTFGSGGKKTDNTGFNVLSSIYSDIQADQKIIVAGRYVENGQSNIFLIKYEANGSRDISFGVNGIVTSNFGSDDYYIGGIKVLDDNNILVTGSSISTTNSPTSFLLAKFLPDGTLNNSFGNNGVVTTAVPAYVSGTFAIDISNNGKIAIGGESGGFAVMVFDANGNLYQPFSGDGIEIHQIGIETYFTQNLNSRIYDLAFSGEYLYATGTTFLPNLSGAVARYLITQGGPLPVTLLDFKANLQNKTVLLSWKIASDKKLDNFIIEKSSNSFSFLPLQFVKPIAPFNIQRNYSSIDLSPFKGTNYYRLKIFESDGKFSYSNIVTINLPGENNISIYPNPASRILKIATNGDNEKAVVEIYDMYGKRVRQLQVTLNTNSLIPIDISTLPKAMYRIKISRQTGAEVMSFIKQ